ncbi:MAG: class II fructose-bisphosphatase, partial [Hoeflea sp.]|nr:class II fructose-bisphosphatase [Hoeflea sp.]
GVVVIGEGERDEAPMLYIGEEVGNREGPKVDIALDPLEGTTICAKNLPNSLAVIAIAEKGSLLYAADVYMDKIAIGPGFPPNTVSLEASPADNIHAVARAKGVSVGEVTACILDRPRHARLIEEVRATGAAIRLIGDGDVAGVIHTTDPDETGIDIYIGIGGAPEGVLAAAALRCIGGQMQGRLQLNTEEKIARAEKMGISDPRRIYTMDDMASGDVLFAATGVTDGNMLQGVRFTRDAIITHTIVMRSSSRTVREIKARHQDLTKFD